MCHNTVDTCFYVFGHGMSLTPIRVLPILLCYVWNHQLGFGTCLDKRNVPSINTSKNCQVKKASERPKSYVKSMD